MVYMIYLYRPFPDEGTRVRIIEDIDDVTVKVEYLDDLYMDVGVQEVVPKAAIQKIFDIPETCQKITSLEMVSIIPDQVIQVARQHVALIRRNERIMRILRDYVNYNQMAYLQHTAWSTIKTKYLSHLLGSLKELYAFVQTLPRLPENLFVYRGVNVMDHRPITQLGYMPHFYLLSTSFNPGEADKFSDTSIVCCHLRIQIPAGYPCIFLSVPGIQLGSAPEGFSNISGNEEIVLLPSVLRLSNCHNFLESMYLEMIPQELDFSVVQRVYKRCTSDELQECLVNSVEYGM